ncbi:MAG: LarC family nickel insertion protein, partial [Treponema sp.]|nr:LarC family nickel insertion protein [Treponema sp.]
MKTLHFDCFAGISGDMALGAFADLGVDTAQVQAELEKLGLGGWKLDFRRDERCGICGTRAVVTVDDHGDHGRDQGDHGRDQGHHGRDHGHHSWKEIRSLIEAAPLSAGAKRRALAIFVRIAEAESQVHGVPVEDIAFHEVGALDSIIDIVGAAVCLDLLKPDRITCSEIELGGGTVHCAHGELPVPAPATLILCRGLPVKTGGVRNEMTTPTGAAIIAASADAFTEAGAFTELKTGYGIGTRQLDRPNVLRLSWREEAAASSRGKPWITEELTLIETNIDDMTGEALGFL